MKCSPGNITLPPKAKFIVKHSPQPPADPTPNVVQAAAALQLAPDPRRKGEGGPAGTLAPSHTAKKHEQKCATP